MKSRLQFSIQKVNITKRFDAKNGEKALGYIYETNRILKSAFEQENNIGTLMDKRFGRTDYLHLLRLFTHVKHLRANETTSTHAQPQHTALHTCNHIFF